MKTNAHELGAICFIFMALAFMNWVRDLSLWYLIPGSLLFGCFLAAIGLFYYEFLSKKARDRMKRIETIKAIPETLKAGSKTAVTVGHECDLNVPIFLPDFIRSRHVHILGATGSGKTESVVLNFLKQDSKRNLGAIILDAKGDTSFLEALEKMIPKEKLFVFDLGSDSSKTYNPLSDGSPIESAQRLFASLVWSEEYYKSKALTALQKIFQGHFEYKKVNPTLKQISGYLSDVSSYQHVTKSEDADKKAISKELEELSGLKDQISLLTIGHLGKILSPDENSDINLRDTESGQVVYFRLQSLMSPQLVNVVGRLVINHLSFISGSIQREPSNPDKVRNIVPVYLDEFASFACPEFADLISKARSAGFALHFAHQSVGDLKKVSESLLSQITDNSATKIVLRINDPDSAEFFARTFGTRVFEKVTKRISNAVDEDLAEFQGEGSSREAHQFRASPDLFKNHPTGVGSVLISHGLASLEGATHVFRIQFPRLSI